MIKPKFPPPRDRITPTVSEGSNAPLLLSPSTPVVNDITPVSEGSDASSNLSSEGVDDTLNPHALNLPQNSGEDDDIYHAVDFGTVSLRRINFLQQQPYCISVIDPKSIEIHSSPSLFGLLILATSTFVTTAAAILHNTCTTIARCY